ncbi:diaminopimelate epimerase [Bacillus sp. S/N-304-OC-R1]|uniref:diaminopimelate epimerase n=1 Tax=Bacillus sp. S/N-304-OC-R1 TaxID=2758034 RepID=UPI001C8DDF0A|nr:diaminopimelate epimerase [Bacillus sp. S/N-304-OC-R1]MBY0122490.1 diaminopimelate epimerase [Bacillus sp. S/N-304-OC-R1]
MLDIPFTKMHGCCNDFIVIDNRDRIMDDIPVTEFVSMVCKRRYSIGADGLMLLENSAVANFKMRYFNADGSEGEMCGNGARCLCRFAYQLGIADKEMIFETMNGIYKASILGNQVQINFPAIKSSSVSLHQIFDYNGQNETYHYAYVGVPHSVWLQDAFERMNIQSFHDWGRMIRKRTDLFPSGTNVNCIEVLDRHHMKIRTYERGVEEETLACGSGATASALIAKLLNLIESPVYLETLGGTLKVSFQFTEEMFNEISLEGNAVIVYKGFIHREAWQESV